MHVSVVYDEFGQIVSVNRPSKDVKAIVLSENRQSVLVTEVSDQEVDGLLGTHRVDTDKRVLVKAPAGPAGDYKKPD